MDLIVSSDNFTLVVVQHCGSKYFTGVITFYRYGSSNNPYLMFFCLLVTEVLNGPSTVSFWNINFISFFHPHNWKVFWQYNQFCTLMLSRLNKALRFHQVGVSLWRWCHLNCCNFVHYIHTLHADIVMIYLIEVIIWSVSLKAHLLYYCPGSSDFLTTFSIFGCSHVPVIV